MTSTPLSITIETQMKKSLILTIIICLSLISVSCAPQSSLQEASPSSPTVDTEETASPTTEGEEEEEESTIISEPTGELKDHFIDVGQGDSILMDLGELEILMDGGGKKPGVVAYVYG